MRRKGTSFCQRGFTTPELVVIAVLITLMILFVVPALNNAKAKARRITCNGYLKNVGLAYRIFATDHSDLFPWQTNWRGSSLQEEYLKYVLVVSNELSTPLLLRCPADTRKAVRDWKFLTRENCSYFLGLTSSETNPQSFLAGDRNVLVDGVPVGPGKTILNDNSIIAWDKTEHDAIGNLALGDGSVDNIRSPRLQDHLKNTGQTNTILIFP